MLLQSIKWVWSLPLGGVVWVGFSFVATVPEAIPEKLEPMSKPLQNMLDYSHKYGAMKESKCLDQALGKK